MGRRIELPQMPSGQTQEQLQALYNYLYRMAEALNGNFSEIGNGDFTDDEMETVREITGSENDPAMSEAETLKSLILKTAKLIKSEIDTYNLKLIGTYQAEGDLGRYIRKTRLDVDVTPTGIQQNYTFEDIVQGLKTYEVNAKNYIKTGLLRTVSSVPVYGVAIGKDVVTFSDEGVETYNDSNKVAELTADELSFWQSGNKVASYTGTAITMYSGNNKLVIDPTNGMSFYNNNVLVTQIKAGRISFYYNGNEAFYILNGKIYAAGDMEIQSGKKFKIVSGGTMDVNTNNFKLDSANKKMVCGNWTFNEEGSSLELDHGYKYGIEGLGISTNAAVGTYIYTVLIPYNSNYRHSYGYGFKVTYLDTDYSIISSGEFNIGYDDFDSGWVFRPKFDSATRDSRYGLGRYNYQYDFVYTKAISAGTDTGEANELHLELGTPNRYGTAVKRYINFRRDSDEKMAFVPINEGDPTGHYGLLGDATNPWHKAYLDYIYYVSLTQSSSRDVKHDIREMESKGEQLDRLRPVTFAYDNDPEEKTRNGLIYEEAVEVMPEICTDDESNKGISYMELVPILLKEIQELRARVKTLEEREGGN